MTTFYIYAPVGLEPWDYSSPDTTGCGGSESHVVETAKRLSRRGHTVRVYSPMKPWEWKIDCEFAAWGSFKQAAFTDKGIWILHRCPAALDNFPVDHPGQK